MNSGVGVLCVSVGLGLANAGHVAQRSSRITHEREYFRKTKNEKAKKEKM
jgi:hypothetical protein